MTQPNPNNPSPEMIEEEQLQELGRLYNYREDDSPQFTRWQMLVAMQHGINLAMQAQQPNPSPDRVERDIEAAMICLAKRAEEIGTHPPTWKELAKEAASAALTTLQARLDAQEERLVETQMLAFKWMEAHDKLQAGKPYKFPSTADVPDSIARLDAMREALEHILNGSLSLPRFAEEAARKALAKDGEV